MIEKTNFYIIYNDHLVFIKQHHAVTVSNSAVSLLSTVTKVLSVKFDKFKLFLILNNLCLASQSNSNKTFAWRVS